MVALKNGKTAEAKTVLNSLYKKNPSDPLLKLRYATTSPCSTANTLYQEICKAENVPDSVKAEAFGRLGDYNYAIRSYTKAAEYYRQASIKSKDSQYKHKWAMASMLSGDIEAAKSLWHTLTLEYGDQISQKSWYYLGLLHLKQTQYQDAYDCFSKSGKTDPGNSWTVAALACKYECAIRLGLNDKVKTYREQLAIYKNTILESDILQPLVVSEKKIKPDSESVKPVTGPDSTPLYTLQVGAFGSVENAAKLQSALNKIFKDVTVIAVTLEEKVFYRVRVGTFSSREDAELFGNESLSKSGYSYKIVQK